MEKKEYIDLFDRFIKGETTETEDQMVFEWFHGENAKEELFSSYEKKWQSVSNEMCSYEQDTIFEKIRKKTDIDRYKSVSRKFVLKSIFRYVAVACLFILLGVGVFQYTKYDYTSRNFIVSADIGQKATVELPDGTIVFLNSGSTLTYNGAYNVQNRRVVLEGEAYFNVKKNMKKAFIVVTGDLEIEALGTSFDVKAYANDLSITTTLLEGKVSVRSESEEIILSPDKQVSFIRATNSFNEPQICNASRFVLWKDDELFFDCETLEQVSETLKKVYSIDIIFMSEEIKAHTFCGVINNTNIHNVLEYLSLTAPVDYEVKNNKIYFMKRNQ